MPTSREQLRHLRDVAEDVGEVPDRHRAAVPGGLREPELQVAHHRLARHHELVHLDHPRPDRDATGGGEPSQGRFHLRSHLEVVVEDRGLPVEQEPRVRHVGLEHRQQRVEQLHEAHAERLERRVPLAVPVRVRDDRDGDAVGCHERASSEPGTPARSERGPSGPAPQAPRAENMSMARSLRRSGSRQLFARRRSRNWRNPEI